MINRYPSKILSSRSLSPALHELVFERGEFSFAAGDEIMIHGEEPEYDRAYSLASGESEDFLRILFRVIPDGLMSPILASKKQGDSLSFTGPLGSFHLADTRSPITFVATGTGIAPALSFIHTHPDLEVHIVHGVHRASDLVYEEWLKQTAYTPCVSGEPFHGFQGRVTGWLQNNIIPKDHDIYLCGANEMIEEVRAMLVDKGHLPGKLYSEPYYFW